jgi:hypothetical protein
MLCLSRLWLFSYRFPCLEKALNNLLKVSTLHIVQLMIFAMCFFFSRVVFPSLVTEL